MTENEIISYYDKLAPTEEVRNDLLKKVRAMRTQKAIIKLVFECAGSLAACVLLALGINALSVMGDAATPNSLFASVVSRPNGYVFSVMVMAILIIVFVAVFVKKLSKINGK